MSEEVLKTGSVILKDPAAEEALTSEWEDGQGKTLKRAGLHRTETGAEPQCDFSSYTSKVSISQKALYVKLDTGARPLFNLGESIAESWTH